MPLAVRKNARRDSPRLPPSSSPSAFTRASTRRCSALWGEGKYSSLETIWVGTGPGKAAVSAGSRARSSSSLRSLMGSLLAASAAASDAGKSSTRPRGGTPPLLHPLRLATLGPAMNLIRPADRYLTVNGLRLRCLDWGGEGRTPLLLLHGFTGHAHAWDTLSIALQPHFHVYALDQRGHGESDPAEVYNPVVAFDDINGVLAELGLTTLTVIGLSMGGRNAMYFAAKRPEAVRRLVIVDIGPEISKKMSQAPPGPPEPETWDSIEQAAQHLLRGNPYPGIHYYRWVASHSLKARPDGRLVWQWH